MGVYIKDLKKPENCDVCPIFLAFTTCGCDRDHCMFQEVPEPHGRLGDLDAIEKQIDYIANLDWNKQVGASGGMLAALEVVEDASTIIQASEEAE